MPRSYVQKADDCSRKKGQWFLISAVIATGGFLAISLLYQGYFVTDPSRITYDDMNQQFMSIRNQLYTIKSNCNSALLDETIKFNQKTMSEKGYFLTVVNNGCDYQLILLSSGTYEIWEGDRVGIVSVI